MVLLSDCWMFDFLVLIISISVLFYWFVKQKHTYWERKGFKSYPNPNILFGHFGSTFTQKEFIGELMARIYKNVNEPFVGIYGFLWPSLLVCDPQAIRNILIKDFQYFTDRGVHCDEVNDPLTGHLFALPGQKWKNLRAKLSPTFTSGKLKAMFSKLVDCGASLQNHLKKLCDNGELLDVREIAASYTTNVIASVAFGIDVDTIKDPNNEFRICGRKIFEPSFWNAFRLMLNFFAPNLITLLRIKSADDSVEKFITSVVKQNLEYREKNNVIRKDFFQLLIQLRNTGTVELDDEWKTVIKGDESQKSLTLNEMVAQTSVFFIAGFETSSTAMTFCMLEFAKNPAIQSQVYKEIDRVLQQHNGKITYDSISEMKYLEACIDETLRKYPIGSVIIRKCVKDYKIPGTDKVIEKGVQIYISVLGLQMDEKYYDEPKKFKPERFTDESSAGKVYLPFGDGPRNCVAMRLGKMQTKVGLVLMLLNYKYELVESKRDMEFDPKHFLLAPKYVVKMRVIKR